MATEKQRRPVKKAQAGVKDKETLTRLSRATHKALSEQAAAIRSGRAETRQDLEAKARRLDIRGGSKTPMDQLGRTVARAR